MPYVTIYIVRSVVTGQIVDIFGNQEKAYKYAEWLEDHGYRRHEVLERQMEIG